MFGGNALVHVSGDFGGFVGVEAFEAEDLEVLLDKGLHVAVEVATVADDALNGGEAILPSLNARFFAEAMFNEEEAASGL